MKRLSTFRALFLSLGLLVSAAGLHAADNTPTARLLPSNLQAPFCYEPGGTRRWPILAAPLVIDLARLCLLAHRRGESGMVRELAVFFKTPAGVAEHDLFKQFDMLERYLLPNR